MTSIEGNHKPGCTVQYLLRRYYIGETMDMFSVYKSKDNYDGE